MDAEVGQWKEEPVMYVVVVVVVVVVAEGVVVEARRSWGACCCLFLAAAAAAMAAGDERSLPGEDTDADLDANGGEGVSLEARLAGPRMSNAAALESRRRGGPSFSPSPSPSPSPFPPSFSPSSPLASAPLPRRSSSCA